MNIKYLFLLLNVLLAVFVASPFIFADEGGGDGDGDDETESPEPEEVSAHDKATAFSEDVETQALAAGMSPVEATKAKIGAYCHSMTKSYTTNKATSKHAAANEARKSAENTAKTAGKSALEAAGIGWGEYASVMQDDMVGTTVVNAGSPVEISNGYTHITPSGYVDFSSTLTLTHSGQMTGGTPSVDVSSREFGVGNKMGDQVTTPGGNPTFSNLEHALSFQEKSNTELSEGSFWGGLATLGSFALNFVPGLGQIKTGYTIVSGIYTTYQVMTKGPITVAKETYDDVAEFASQTLSSTKTAYNSITSPSISAPSAMAEKSNPLGAQGNVKGEDSRTGPSYSLN